MRKPPRSRRVRSASGRPSPRSSLPVVRTRLSLDRQPPIDRRVPHRLLGGDDRRGSVKGRGWVRRADGFAVLFTKLAAMSPVHRDDDGRLRLRSPLAGLSTLPTSPARCRSSSWCSARPRSTVSPAARSGSTSQVNRPAGVARSAARSACSSSPAGRHGVLGGHFGDGEHHR